VNEREAARSKGISTGRYVLYNKYKDLENDLSLEDAKDADVNVLIKSMLDVASEERNPEAYTDRCTSKTFKPTSTPTPTLMPTPTPTPTPADKIAYGQFMKFESSNYRGYYIRVKSSMFKIVMKIPIYSEKMQMKRF